MCDILLLLFLNQIEGMCLPVTSKYISLNNFWNPKSGLNTWESEENLYFSDFFLIKPIFEHCKEDSTRFAIAHEIAALGT